MFTSLECSQVELERHLLPPDQCFHILQLNLLKEFEFARRDFNGFGSIERICRSSQPYGSAVNHDFFQVEPDTFGERRAQPTQDFQRRGSRSAVCLVSFLEHRHGVLKLELPKVAEVKATTIEVKPTKVVEGKAS